MALWHRFGAMAQVLSLMETHSGDRLQFRFLEWKKNVYTQVHHDEDAYTWGFVVQKSRICRHALSCKEKCIHVGELIFGPCYLVLGI